MKIMKHFRYNMNVIRFFLSFYKNSASRDTDLNKAGQMMNRDLHSLPGKRKEFKPSEAF